MKLVTIKSFDNYVQAHIVLGALSEAGVQAFLQDEFASTITPMSCNRTGGVKLVVSEEELPHANEILQKLELEKKAKLVCPKCGSHEVQYIVISKPTNLISAIVSFLFARYSVAPEAAYHCYNCGFEFEELPSDFSAGELS